MITGILEHPSLPVAGKPPEIPVAALDLRAQQLAGDDKAADLIRRRLG